MRGGVRGCTPSGNFLFYPPGGYIVLNAVRAAMVKHPHQWPWSSYRATTAKSAAPASVGTLLSGNKYWGSTVSSYKASLRPKKGVIR